MTSLDNNNGGHALRIVLGITAMVILMIGGAGATPPIINGPVAEYHFDGNANDSSGNGNHGTIFGGAGFVHGVSGQAMSFDGVDDYVRVADAGSLEPSSDLTIEAWINLSNLVDNQYGDMIVHKWTSGVGNGYGMYIYNGKITSTFGTSGSGHCNITGDTIQKNLWYQFSYTYNDSSKTCKLFKNGQLVDSINNWLTIPANSDVNLGIGKRDDTDDGYFNGIIDEIRIYNRALSADEIKAHYNEVMRVHNINKGTDYTTIQAAINDSNPGDEIQVDSGTYYENVNITKRLTLRGIGMPVVDSEGNGSAITLAADGIILEGFNATGSRNYPDAGINVNSSNNTLIGNNVSNNAYGIYLSYSSNSTLIGNDASNNIEGIFLYYSGNNMLSYNNVQKCRYGIVLDYSSNNMLSVNNANSNNYHGIILYYYSNNNTISGNNANSNNYYGIGMDGSSNNTLSWNNANSNHQYSITLSSSSNNNMLIGNNASSNGWYGFAIFDSSNNMLSGNNASSNGGYGIGIFDSSNNKIYNNIFNNTENYYFDNLYNITHNNTWNTTLQSSPNIIGGSSLGGNFWANPYGTGFSQTCIDMDRDGICDSPYVLNSSNIDYLPLAPIPAPALVFSMTPNSRNAQLGTPVTLFMSVINSGKATATGVSIIQASSLPVNLQYRQWDGTAFIEDLNTPIDIPANKTANFVIGINATSEFSSSPMTFNVSGTNVEEAPVSAVNTLTISASSTPSADVIMMSTSLDIRTAVNTSTAFAVATANVGGAGSTGVSLILDIPDTITGLMYQLNETYPANGTIKGPATGLTIGIGDQPTFAVFLTPTQPIAYDPANNRITLQLVNGSGRVIGAQSVSVSTT